MKLVNLLTSSVKGVSDLTGVTNLCTAVGHLRNREFKQATLNVTEGALRLSLVVACFGLAMKNSGRHYETLPFSPFSNVKWFCYGSPARPESVSFPEEECVHTVFNATDYVFTTINNHANPFKIAQSINSYCNGEFFLSKTCKSYDAAWTCFKGVMDNEKLFARLAQSF